MRVLPWEMVQYQKGAKKDEIKFWPLYDHGICKNKEHYLNDRTKSGQNASLCIGIGGCRPQGPLGGCGGHSPWHRVEKRWFEALTSRRLG